jgi:hypothetical protein
VEVDTLSRAIAALTYAYDARPVFGSLRGADAIDACLREVGRLCECATAAYDLYR